MKQTLLCFRRSGMGFHISRQRWHSIRFKGFSLLALNRDLSECILFLNINFRSTCTNIIISLFERIEERNFLPMHLPFHATRSTSFIDLFDQISEETFHSNGSIDVFTARVFFHVAAFIGLFRLKSYQVANAHHSSISFPVA